MMEYLMSVRERPVWRPVPEEVKERLRRPLPLDPEAPERIYEDFTKDILPYPLGNIHPRFWGWVCGTGTPLGMLAEMLAAGMNSNLAGADHVANYVEAQVLQWCKEMLGYPREASGILVSGCSMANLIGLAVARNAVAGFDVRREGLQGGNRRIVFYSSTEAHASVQKAVELLGLGSKSLRKIPVDEEFRIHIASLRRAVSRDRKRGYHPGCVVGNAGTINTGAIDDLDRLADFCEREDLWFHVDGAFGALAALSAELRHLVSGIERADSLAFDFHKWMYMPIEIGCVLVRNEAYHRQAFSIVEGYLAHEEGGLAGGAPWFHEYGLQLTRGFRALKAWMSIREHGVRKYGRLIKQNVEQARYLARLVDGSKELERLAPVPLNIVCFRFKEAPAGVDLDAVNRAIFREISERGIAVPSYARIRGKYCLRVAITNHRSRREDFDLLVREVIRIGRSIVGKAIREGEEHARRSTALGRNKPGRRARVPRPHPAAPSGRWDRRTC